MSGEENCSIHALLLSIYKIGKYLWVLIRLGRVTLKMYSDTVTNYFIKKYSVT